MNRSGNGGSGSTFFNKTGAVAGVFTIVGIACAAIAVALIAACLRNRRRRRAEEAAGRGSGVGRGTAAGMAGVFGPRRPLEDEITDDENDASPYPRPPQYATTSAAAEMAYRDPAPFSPPQPTTPRGSGSYEDPFANPTPSTRPRNLSFGSHETSPRRLSGGGVSMMTQLGGAPTHHSPVSGRAQGQPVQGGVGPPTMTTTTAAPFIYGGQEVDDRDGTAYNPYNTPSPSPPGQSTLGLAPAPVKPPRSPRRMSESSTTRLLNGTGSTPGTPTGSGNGTAVESAASVLGPMVAAGATGNDLSRSLQRRLSTGSLRKSSPKTDAPVSPLKVRRGPDDIRVIGSPLRDISSRIRREDEQGTSCSSGSEYSAHEEEEEEEADDEASDRRPRRHTLDMNSSPFVDPRLDPRTILARRLDSNGKKARAAPGSGSGSGTKTNAGSLLAVPGQDSNDLRSASAFSIDDGEDYSRRVLSVSFFFTSSATRLRLENVKSSPFFFFEQVTNAAPEQ